MWVVAACASALFAGLVAILGKLGVQTTDSDVATAVRTCVVVVLAWIVAVCAGSVGTIAEISPRTWVFLVLSGLATGASWLCYYYAIQTGVVSAVVQIDKLSIVVSIAFSWLVLQERISRKALCGLALIVAGTVGITAFA